MRDELALRKALMQADRGDTAGAELTVRDVLARDVADGLRVRALVVLGDLLGGHDEDAARAALTEALALAAGIEDADDLLDVEVDRAREILAGRREQELPWT